MGRQGAFAAQEGREARQDGGSVDRGQIHGLGAG